MNTVTSPCSINTPETAVERMLPEVVMIMRQV